jgi:hypothetical protein
MLKLIFLELLIMILCKLTTLTDDNWNYIGKWWLKKYDQIYNTEYFFTACSDFKGLQIYTLPIHYKGGITYSDKRFEKTASTFWNNLPSETQNEQSLEIFAKNVKTYRAWP